MTVPSEAALEKIIQEKGLEAPRVTPEMIDAMIKDQSIVTIDGVGMFCIITLHNGFKLVGKSMVVDDRNFDTEIGKSVSYKDARAQIWPYAGFMLAEDLYRGVNPLTEAQRKLPAHVQRVITEMYQVAARLMGLCDFLTAFDSKTIVMTLAEDELADLREQQKIMTAYVQILQQRLDRAGV